jgi:hypothetical protein
VIAIDAKSGVLVTTDAEAVEALIRVVALHRPFGIYDECGHNHGDGEGDDSLIEVDEIGYVCEAGKQYDICTECCTDDLGWTQQQTERCAEDHTHGKDEPRCPTVAAILG